MATIKMNQFVKGAFLLTFIGILSKVLSAFYRIPIQNVTGDIGFYTYQQVYPFIATVMILSLYSFPSAVSKIGAQIGEENRTFKQFILPNFIILLLINGLLFLIVHTMAPFIAMLSGNMSLQRAYETIAYAFLLIPFLSISRGYFQSSGEMRQTAYSQLIEQTVRVAIIIVSCFLIYKYHLDVFKIGIYGSIASIVSMLIAILLFMIFFFNQRKILTISSHFYQTPWKIYMKTMLVFGLVFALNHMLFIFIQLADVLSLIPMLIKYGLVAETAMVSKGVFDRAIPLIQLGVVIGSSFAVALIPMMSSRHTKKEKSETIQQALSLCMYISAGATVGLVVLFPEINLLLFKTVDETISLRIFSLATILLALMMTVNPILQMLGKHWQTIIYIVVAFMMKILLNLLLVPKFGLFGASLATIMAVGLLVVVQFLQLKRTFPEQALLMNLKWKAISLAVVFMVTYLFVWKWLVPFSMMSRVWLLGYVLFLVVSGATIYFLTLLRNKAFSKKQIKALPFSSILLTYAYKNGKAIESKGDSYE